MSKNELATTETTAVAAVTEPEFMVAVEATDMMVPFLKVIQSLSEELIKGKDKYNEAVRAGDIYDSVTQTIFTDSNVVIAGLKKYYAEWTPEVRGTLVGKHPVNSPTVTGAQRITRTTEKGGEFTQLRTLSGNDLVETYGVVMLAQKDGLTIPAVLTLSKTSFMVGKQLSTMLALHQRNGIPSFKLTTTSVSNTKGSWYKPVFTFSGYEKDAGTIETLKGLAGAVDAILFKSNATEGEAVTVNPDDEII